MRTVFNLEALVSVEIVGRKLCGYLAYVEPYRNFWGKERGGYFRELVAIGSTYTAEELESNGYCGVPLLVDGNKAYFRPYVRLTFAGGTTRIERFKTKEEALVWGTAQANQNITSQLILPSTQTI